MMKINWKIISLFGITFSFFFMETSLWAISPDPLSGEELKKLIEQPLTMDSNLLSRFTGTNHSIVETIHTNGIPTKSVSLEQFSNAIQSSELPTVKLSECKSIQKCYQRGLVNVQEWKGISKATECVFREIHDHIITQEKLVTEEIRQAQEELVEWAHRASEKTSEEIQEIRNVTKESFPLKTFAYTQVAAFAFVALLEKFFRS
uniref:Uncharacterized protein n=1 Tax=Andalucia godoyi TaxID=505711 RepID=M4Q9H0_ANDGO|nr:hypothetical protein L069_p021 [Andalucia godoyi]AGH24011.1 hypothetical protein [Andalucia godoyi]